MLETSEIIKCMFRVGHPAIFYFRPVMVLGPWPQYGRNGAEKINYSLPISSMLSTVDITVFINKRRKYKGFANKSFLLLINNKRKDNESEQ